MIDLLNIFLEIELLTTCVESFHYEEREDMKEGEKEIGREDVGEKEVKVGREDVITDEDDE